MTIEDDSPLVGPDAADQPIETIQEFGGDQIDVAARQFVNRWVFLAHQRPAAIKELRILIAQAKTAALKADES